MAAKKSRMPEFTRVVGYIPSSDDECIVPWLFEPEEALSKMALLVAEHTRLYGLDAEAVENALMEWFSDPDLRFHWLEKGDVPLLESVTAEPETGTLRLHFRTCILTDEELEMARTTEDPD